MQDEWCPNLSGSRQKRRVYSMLVIGMGLLEALPVHNVDVLYVMFI